VSTARLLSSELGPTSIRCYLQFYYFTPAVYPELAVIALPIGNVANVLAREYPSLNKAGNWTRTKVYIGEQPERFYVSILIINPVRG